MNNDIESRAPFIHALYFCIYPEFTKRSRMCEHKSLQYLPWTLPCQLPSPKSGVRSQRVSGHVDNVYLHVSGGLISCKCGQNSDQMAG